nr:T9SS C-terminal target domain-containing protein [uncultured Flavobacterium sp.]
MFKFLTLFFLFTTSTYSQIKGCTDRFASNFDPNATENNGRCWYASAKVKPEFSTKLSDSITGTSGLIPFDGLLWTHNDHFDTTFYGLDFKGKVKKKINFPDLKSNDWEDISQDSLYIYLGDFGNNNRGNRKDLRVLRIQKESFFTKNPVIDTIAFSYANQKDFKPLKEHTSDFDCEAFVVLQDSIYLFTKQWSKEKTSVYILPKNPGTYIAELKETIDAEGLITGATALPSKKGIVLCGYSKFLQPFVLLLYDYKNNDFWTGNNRKIKVKLPFHQIEAITTEDGKLFYLTNEATVKKPFVDTAQQFHTIDLSPYLKD